MSALTELLERLPLLTLVVGKGGVGKTTCAAGIATHLGASGRRTLLLSTDPASSLSDAIGESLGAGPRRVRDNPRLDAMQLSARAARDAFLKRWRETIIGIVDRGTYLDAEDVAGLVDAALPGADEVFALLEIAALLRDGGGPHPYERLIVDTAPTGHTLRLLALPDTLDALVALLDEMQEKHRFMVRALTHRYRTDAADLLIETMRSEIGGLRTALTDSTRSAAVLVARGEQVVVAESARYAAALAAARIAIAAVVVNAIPQEPNESERAALAALRDVARDEPHYGLPRARHAPDSSAEIETLMTRLYPLRPDNAGASAAVARAHRRPAVNGAADVQALLRELGGLALLVVGGKGGVGKTTVSCALAVRVADEGGATLLVSTDPAPSIADALAQTVGDEETAVAGASGLYARQMDASAAFSRFREQYQSRIDDFFEALLGHGLDIAHDRAILRDLLALAPPGIDELYSLASLGETVVEGRFARVLIDPAPTGHLLRLLEMPVLALDWTHRLMRLLLKYKEVAGLGEMAEQLLGFAKRTRGIQALLQDPQRARLLVVTLDEPLVRQESIRLVEALRELHVPIAGALFNRTGTTPSPLPTELVPAQFVAPTVEPPPVGVSELRDWSRQWRALSTHHG